MKLNKKVIMLIFVSGLVLTSIPNYTLAIETFANYFPNLAEGTDGEYLMVYKYDRISNENIVDEWIKSRLMRRTPTEFQIIESDDVIITDWRFNYNTVNFDTNKTALVVYDDKAYLFLAAGERASNNLTFFITKSTDNGRTWDELDIIYNSSITTDNFYDFEVTYRTNTLMMAYSYYNLTTPFNYTDVVDFHPLSYNILDEKTSADFWGTDFSIYPYDNRIYIATSVADVWGPQIPLIIREYDESYLKLTYTNDGSQFDGPELHIETPYNKTNEYNPEMVAWNGGIFIIAHDKLTDEFNPSQNIIFDEYFLWGVWVDDITALEPTLEYYNVIKNVADGYLRKDPQISIYEDRLFVSFLVDEGSRFGGASWPEIDFAFSDDGKVWTRNYMGNISLFMNLGAFFVMATVGTFVIILPSLYFYNRYKKGK